MNEDNTGNPDNGQPEEPRADRLSEEAIKNFLELSDERELERIPEFIDPDPPHPLTQRQWDTLIRFADIIIPPYQVENPEVAHTRDPNSAQRIEGAGQRGFKSVLSSCRCGFLQPGKKLLLKYPAVERV